MSFSRIKRVFYVIACSMSTMTATAPIVIIACMGVIMILLSSPSKYWVIPPMLLGIRTLLSLFAMLISW